MKYERVLHRYYKKCGCQVETQGEWFELSPADITFLSKPNTIAEQNNLIDQILKMMQEQGESPNLLNRQESERDASKS